MMAAMRIPAAVSLLVACASSTPPVSPTPAPSLEPPPVVKEEVKETKKEPEGPPFVIEKLTVAPKMKGEEVSLLELSWDVTRKNDVEKGTILFVHSTCKVGYKTNYEDETVSGVDTIGKGEARRFNVNAYASVGLKFEPAWCSFAFASGPKGTSSETKLTTFCWKKRAVSEGPCA